ncbi:MAG: precorrin-6A reductase [Candidatus Schekmanbacteria bacterium]|nr:precorrin-6A reductase [Candidatus Schekmanbacteria bacterium]
MILVFAGTKEGREIANLLIQEGYPLIVSVTDNYGKKLLPPNVMCHQGKLNQEQLAEFIVNHRINLMIDATHPFAVEASQNAIDVCKKKHVEYIRFEREKAVLPKSPLIHLVKDFPEAARLAVTTGKRIFLTIGSKNIAVFCALAKKSKAEIVLRVLPSPGVLENCLKYLSPSRIIALQGPCSVALNKAMFQEYQTDVIVTKDSGREGGTEAKIEAALSLAIPIIIIQRPAVIYPNQVNNYQELLTKVNSL